MCSCNCECDVLSTRSFSAVMYMPREFFFKRKKFMLLVYVK